MAADTQQDNKPDDNMTETTSTPASSLHTGGGGGGTAVDSNTSSNGNNGATNITIDTSETDGACAGGGNEAVQRIVVMTNGGEAGGRPSRYCQRRRGRRGLGNPQRGGFMVTGLRSLQSRHGQWTCFFCCHVTTGTAIIGAWHVLLHMLAMSLLSIALVYPGLLGTPTVSDGAGGVGLSTAETNAARRQAREHMDTRPGGPFAVNCSSMPCFLATQHEAGYPHVAPDFPLALGHLLSTHQLNSEAVSVAVFITLCTLFVTLLLLCGVHRQQPSHLMPFFFLQVFDFCISSMTMISYLSYLPNLRLLLQDTPAFPFREQLLAMQTNCLTFFVMLIFIATFMVKAYCISIVWRCYKYLLVCRAALVTGQSTASLLAAAAAGAQNASSGGVGRSGVMDGRAGANNAGPEHCMQWLLQQDYRSKMAGAFPEPPPSYDMAMAAFLSTDAGHPTASPGAQDQSTAAAAAMDDSPLLPRYEDAVLAAPFSPAPVAGGTEAEGAGAAGRPQIV